MPRVLVTDEDRTVVAWDERVTLADFETEHFRRQLTERLSWAVADAARRRRRPSHPDTRAPDPGAPR
jgi:hypothetical protein